MKHKKFAVLSLLALGTASLARAAGFGPVPESKVTFEAVGPAGLKINGATSGIRAVESDGKVTLTVPTGGFETGIGLRDKHLREYLEVEKHPSAQLVVDESKISLPDGAAPATGKIVAPLTLHGATNPTAIAYKIRRDGSAYSVEGEFEVNIQDFKIKKPCYLGVCVADRVKVAAKFTIQKG